MKKSYLLAMAILSSNVAYAEKEEHREHGAHEHGHAQLSVIVEKNELLVSIETPAMNVFGFEHKPKNEEQMHVVETAVEDLEKFGSLLTVDSGAKCSFVKAKVEQPFEISEEHHDDHKDEHKDHDDDHKDEHKDDHDEHAKHDDDHKDEHKDHDDDHKDEHKDGHDEHAKHDDDHKDEHKDHDEHEEESAHTDVDVEISYSCKDASKLEKMDLTAFFKRFPLFEELEAQGIINGKQSAAELSAKQPVFSLK